VSIDPKEFGEMLGYAKATHLNVEKLVASDIKQNESLHTQDKRIQTLEDRNTNVKENWKKAGVFTAIISVIGGFCRWIWTSIT